MADHGIDYGMGETNIDKETGIRYGVIPMRALHDYAHEDFEDDYGEPTCGHCGNELVEYDAEAHDHYPETFECCDYACEHCGIIVGRDNAYGEEPIGSHLDDGIYKASYDSDGDVFILKSPYYTYAQFCSPCAPGAGYLLNPVDSEDGPRAYCFGHEWFEDGIAPYPVYEVVSGKLVMPPAPKS